MKRQIQHIENNQQKKKISPQQNQTLQIENKIVTLTETNWSQQKQTSHLKNKIVTQLKTN